MTLDSANIAVRLGLYLDLMALFGLAAFGLYALRGEERRFGAVLGSGHLVAGTALLGLLLSVLGLALLAASMAGMPLSGLDRSSFTDILQGTSVGTAWLIRMGALAAALPLVLVGRARPTVALAGVAAAGAAALGSLAWTGHGVMDEGAAGWAHLVADMVHLLAAGIWIGALVALLLLVLGHHDRMAPGHLAVTHRALSTFSSVGTAAVAAIVASGLLNSWFVIGPSNLLQLSKSLYGQLLIVKLGLFGLMLLLAAANRFRLVPNLERALDGGDERAALSALRRSLVMEAGCGALVLGLVAWLGTLEPTISASQTLAG